MFTNLLVLGAGKRSNGANARGVWAGMLVLALAFMALQPRTVLAIAGGRIPDIAFGTSGMTNACMYQEWTNGTGVPLFQPPLGQNAPTPVGVVGLGAPTFTGTLINSSVQPFVSIVNGNTTWSIPHGATTDNSTAQWDAYFFASADGTYTFNTRSDDGSMLWIGTTNVVFNNFSQGATTRSGNIILNQGFHLMTMTWGNGVGGYDMTASSQYNGGAAVNIDTNMFLRLLPTPTFSPTFPPLNQTNQLTLNVSILVSGAAPTAQQKVYYTTDGSTPTVASNLYNPASPIAISVPKTINAIVTQVGFNNSQVGTISYTQPPAGAPTFSPLPGSYAFGGAGLTVTITSATANSFIYYTLDGSTPTFQNYNTVGASPQTVTLNGTTTINAFSSALGFAPSSVVAATYTRTNVTPFIVSCLASGLPNQVNVVFNAPVSAATANNIANYQINNGVTVSAAALDSGGSGDKKTVRLTVTPLSPGIAYNLTVTNINDIGNTSTLLSATTQFQYFDGGGLLYERYENVPGNLVSDMTAQPPITFFPDFPASYTIDPAPGMVLPTFEEPQNTSFLSYGSRMSGYFIAPATGFYQFAVTADDTAIFSLSLDDNPNKKGFATAVVTKTSNPRQWNYDVPPIGTDENKTSILSLVAGKRYYIETLHKQDFSLDNLAVTYVFPPQTFVDTPGAETLPTDAFFNGNIQLSPAIDALRIVKQPTPQQFATPNQQVTLVFDVSGSAPRNVQWSLDKGSGAVDIPGANFGVYIIPNMTAADAGTYYCRMTNTITTVPLVSNGAIVTLLDVTPISVTGISAASGTLAGITNFPVAGGMQTVVSGQHFVPGMLVTINGITAQVVSSTATTITVTVPASVIKGTVNVSVTKPGGGPVTLVGAFTYDDAPVAAAQILTVLEDTATVGATLSATDQSDKIVSFKIVQQPTKGTLVISGATLANKSSTGTVVTMTTTAPHGFVVGNTVSVACIPPDAKIDLVNAVITVVTANTFSYAKSAVAVVFAPTGGTAQLITNTPAVKPFTGTIPFTYTPFPNLNNNTATVGPDTFTFTANDGFLDSAPVTVTINITPVNDAPTINNPGNQTVPEDAPVTIILNNVFVSPATATDERTGGAGAQTFTSLTVTSNNAPLFQTQDGLFTNTLSITQTPAQFTAGTASLKFTPALPGSATLTVTLVDSGSGVAPNVNTTVMQFNVTVTSVNDAPVINNPGPQVGTGDVSSTVPLTGIAAAPPNNPDEYPAQNPGLTLSVSSSDPTYFTSLTVSAIGFVGNIGSATLSYVPTFARNGPVTITVTVDDHQAVNNTTSIQFVLNLSRVNHRPTAVNDFYSPTVNKVFTVPAPGVLGNDTDPDTNPVDVLSVAAVPAHTSPANGVLVLNANGSFTYTPNAGFSGIDTFTYFVTDGALNSLTSATVTFNVGVNLPPVAMDQVIPAVEDIVLNATLNGTDPNFDTLTFKIETQPAIGTVVLTNATTGAFSYTPPLNFNGSVTFTYSANDGQFNSNIATVTINVAPVNDAPVATPQSVFAGQNKSLVIILTATDVDNDPLTFSITVPPTQGILSAITQLTPTSAKVTYTPNVNYIGADSFQFTAKDATLTSAPATVSITVTPPPVFSSTPTVSPNPALTGSPVTGSASAIVTNGTATITWNFGDGGTATGTDVTYVYTQSGVFTITVTATSPEGLTTTYTLVIQVGIGLVSPVPPGAVPPGIYGFLVGGLGVTAGDKAALSVNYVSREKTAFSGTVSGLAFPANLNQGQLVNQVGMVTFGQGALAQQFVFTLDANGKGKATGLPLVQVGLRKGTFSFKESGRKEMTDLIIALGAGNVVQGNGHQVLNIPVSLQIGNSLFLAMTFQLDYVQTATTGKGKLIVPGGKKHK